MSLINRNIEQKNNKILKVLDITKVDGEISELDVVEFRNEGKVYSEGTPLEANCLNNVIQEIIDNALQQRNNADYNNLSFTEEITAEVPLPVKGENGSKLSWSVTKGTAITISNNVMSVVRGNQDEECKLLVTCTLGKFITSKEFDVKVLGREMTREEVVDFDLKSLEIEEDVYGNFDLPQYGENGSTFAWESLNEDFIVISGNTAVVTRTLVDTVVELRVRATYNGYSESQYFMLSVKARGMTDLEKVRADLNEISLPSEVTSDFDLPLVGSNGSSIVWSITSGTGITISSSTALVTRELYRQTVELKAEVTNETQTVTGDYDVIVLAREMTDLEKVNEDLNEISLPSEVTSDFDLPLVGSNGSSIVWSVTSGTGITISSSTALVTRELYRQTVELKAEVTNETQTVTGDYDVIVLAREMTDLEKVNEDLNEISLPSEVTSDFDLPLVGSNGSSIVWSITSGTGITISSSTALVTRELYRQTVELKAEVTNETQTVTGDYDVIVLAREMTDLEKVNEDLNEISLPSEVTSDFDLPLVGSNGSSIVWSITSGTGITISSSTALVTRELYRQTVELKAEVTNETQTVTGDYDVIVLAREMTDLEKVNEDLNEISLPSEVTSDFDLPLVGSNGSSIVWSITSGTGITISSSTALVTRELYRQTVELKAEVTNGTQTVTRYYDVTILAREMTDLEKVRADLNEISLPSEVTSDFDLPLVGSNGSSIVWSVTSGTGITISSSTASVTRELYEQTVELKVEVTKGSQTVTRYYDVTILAREMTDLEKVRADLNEISLPSEVTSDFDLPLVGSNGSNIVWSVTSGTGITISSSTASVTRELYEQTVELKVEVTKGSQTVTRYYDVTILAREMTREEVVDFDLKSLEIEEDVYGNFDLPQYGENGSTFAWESLNEDFIVISGNTAVVTRTLVDTVVELRVRATYNGYSESQYFMLSVKARGMTDLEKVRADLNEISLPSTTGINITLPTTGLYSSSISWSIKNGYGVSISENTLKVVKYLTDRTVVLTATVTYGSSSVSGDFNIIIEKMTDLEVVYNDISYIDVPSQVSDNFFLTTYGDLGSTIEWDSADRSVINFVDGEAIVTRGEGDQTIPISATITYGTATITEYYIVIVLGL